MAAADEFKLISTAARMALLHAERVEGDTLDQLQTSGSTMLVNALRTVAVHSSIVAIGTFAVLESTLQQTQGWKAPFDEVDKRLRAIGSDDLAERFRHFRRAVNTLKHGQGLSYDCLVRDRAVLPFKIVGPGDLVEEGDVGAVTRLVEADHAFVEAIIETIVDVSVCLKL